MGERVEFKRPDGETCAGYLARPSGAGGPGIVVVQEWWGLNPQIQGMADRFAAAGFAALVPDLFRGRVAGDAEEASHLMNHLDFLGAAQQDLRGAVQHLKALGHGKVAVTGFCMGGALTLLSAALVPEVDAGVCFYGIPPAAAADLGQIKVPLQAHFADQDYWCTAAAIDDLKTRLAADGVKYELFMYRAEHAFMNEARPEVFDRSAADLAWSRTLEFLGRAL